MRSSSNINFINSECSFFCTVTFDRRYYKKQIIGIFTGLAEIFFLNQVLCYDFANIAAVCLVLFSVTSITSNGWEEMNDNWKCFTKL